MEHAFGNPDFLWRNPEPRAAYDVAIVGGGLHGLSTAYHLARYHGVRNVAVLERGWLSSNNVLLRGRLGTAVVDSGYWTHSAQTVRGSDA